MSETVNPQPVAPPVQEQKPVEQVQSLPKTEPYDVNKLIAEIEVEQKKKEDEYRSSIQKLIDEKISAQDKVKQEEITKLKQELDKTKQESHDQVSKLITEYKDKLNNIDKQLSERTTVVPNQSNPFRQQPDKPTEDWYKDPNVSEKDKFDKFIRMIRR